MNKEQLRKNVIEVINNCFKYKITNKEDILKEVDKCFIEND